MSLAFFSSQWISTPWRNGSKASERQPPASRLEKLRLPIAQTFQNLIDARRPADDSALGADHVEGGHLELREIAFGGVLGQQALEAAVVGLAHGGLHANFRSDSGEHQLPDAEARQMILQARGVERALARLLDHDLAVPRCKLGKDSGTAASCGCGSAWPAGNRTGPGGGIPLCV